MLFLLIILGLYWGLRRRDIKAGMLRAFLAIFICQIVGVSALYSAEPRYAHEGVYWNLMDGHILMLQSYEPVSSIGQKKKYSVLKVSIREGAAAEPFIGSRDPEGMLREYFHQTYVPNVLKFVRAFVEKNYVGRQRTEAIEALKSERDFYSAPATWVIVTDENNLEVIHSVMRVVRKELLPSSMLPLNWEEVVLGKMTDEQVGARLDQHHQMALLDVEQHTGVRLPEQERVWDENKNMWIRTWAEMKTFVGNKDPETEESFTRLMLYALMINGLHLRPQGWFDIPFATRVKTSALSEVTAESWEGNSHFVLETDRLGARLWSRFGFKEYQAFPNRNIYVMTATLNDFERASFSWQSETGQDFKTTLLSPNHWQPHIVYPPEYYREFLADRNSPPVLRLDRTLYDCKSLLGQLRIPFFLDSSNPMNIDWVR